MSKKLIDVASLAFTLLQRHNIVSGEEFLEAMKDGAENDNYEAMELLLESKIGEVNMNDKKEKFIQ